MLIKSLSTKLEKFGLKIKKNNNNNPQYWIKANNYTLSGYSLGGYVTCLHIRRSNDENDIMTDYFPGHYPASLKSALKYMGVEK